MVVIISRYIYCKSIISGHKYGQNGGLVLDLRESIGEKNSRAFSWIIGDSNHITWSVKNYVVFGCNGFRILGLLMKYLMKFENIDEIFDEVRKY